MGLTKSAVGKNAVDGNLTIRKKSPDERIIALAGNPNVGKSTVFNALTGLNQHTGNWPGKTVANAMGSCQYGNKSYVFVDIPGTYSLLAHSAEEEVARNFICFGNPDATIVVCDATCLERNLNLVLQTLEISKNVIVCVNLMDEAKKKNISVDLKLLSKRLGVNVVSTVARKKKSLAPLLKSLDKMLMSESSKTPYCVTYCEEIEKAISKLEPIVEKLSKNKINSRWLSLKLIDCDDDLKDEIASFLGTSFIENEELLQTTESVKNELLEKGFTPDKIKDSMVAAVVESAEEICRGVISPQNAGYGKIDRKTDEILTSRKFGYPIMLVLLTFIFWLTISGANYPSQLLSNALFALQEKISDVFIYFNAPPWLRGIIVSGAFRVLAWVTSVMLPPMAIFFPLFTLLEDSGYLPRIAYNLDKPFKKCRACGKQALTMW